MGHKEIRAQRALLDRALNDATEPVRRYALDGTIGDTRSFCWAALRQFERRDQPGGRDSPQDFGLRYADLHLLLVVAQEAVAHAELVEQLLASLGESQALPPARLLRERLREARNLLAEHRDERVLYWRLTGNKTPHVIDRYARLGVSLPHGSIDFEVLGYVLPSNGSPADIAGSATVGTLGGLLSLPELREALLELEGDLDVLAARHAGRGTPVANLAWP